MTLWTFPLPASCCETKNVQHSQYLVVGVVADGIGQAFEHGVQQVRLDKHHLLDLHVLLASLALLAK